MKCFIIILKEVPISIEIGNKCLEQAKKFGIKPDIFNGIYGSEADSVFEKFNYKIKNKYAKRSMNKQPGVRGCTASHLILLNNCIKDDVPYLIMEHDSYIIRSLPNNIINSFDDIIRLDPYHPMLESYNEDIKHGNTIFPYNNFNKNDIRFIQYKKPNLKSVKKNRLFGTLFDDDGALISSRKDDTNYEYFAGTYGYIIKPNGAKKVIRYIEEYGLFPADWLFNNFCLNLMTTSETIIRIHPDYNAIANKKKRLSTTTNLGENHETKRSRNS